MEEKLKNLKKNLEKIKKTNQIGNNNEDKQKSQFLMNIAIETITIPLVSTWLGYMLDKYFDTKIIFLLICLCFGIISSIVNIYKKLNKF